MNSKDLASKIMDIPIEEIIRDLLPNNQIIPEPNKYSSKIMKTNCFAKGISIVPALYFDKYSFFCFECGKRGNQYDLVRQFYEYQMEDQFSTEKYFCKKLSISIDPENIELIQDVRHISFFEFNDTHLTDIHKRAKIAEKHLLNKGNWGKKD